MGSLQYAAVCAVVIASGLTFFIPRQATFQEWITGKPPASNDNTTNDSQPEKPHNIAPNEETTEKIDDPVGRTELGNVNVYFVCDVPNETDAEIEKDREAPTTEKDCEAAPTTEKDCEARETKKSYEAALGAAAANTAMKVKHKEGMEVSTSPPPEEDISVWTSI